MPTKMAEKNAGSTTCGNEELVFLANAIKEGRKRRLKMQLALNNLAARRRQVLEALGLGDATTKTTWGIRVGLSLALFSLQCPLSDFKKVSEI